VNLRTVFALVLLLAAALASWYVARRDDTSAGGPTSTPPRHRGYYLEDTRILGTDTDGSLLYEIRAAHAEQQADEDILFSTVTVRYSPASAVPWTIKADTATLAPNEQRVILEGNVSAESAKGFSGDETLLRTSLLILNPENYTAETDARIEIRIGNRSLSGTGMLAFLKENRVEIRSNVSGRFVP
jgi:lipopolysaccharide export system protein LptC